MSVQRQLSILGQSRVEVSDIRSIESAVAYDFDVLAGRVMAGQQPLVVRGFTVVTTAAVGHPATNLQLVTANGLVMHWGASDAGTCFDVPATQASEQLTTTNPTVTGSFAASATNYVGIDLIRRLDASTSDLTKFLDATIEKEVAKTVPKARSLGYRVIISQQPFSASTNVCPVAKVTTDASNNVLTVTDARKLMFRLGSGGDNPTAASAYAWASRVENPLTYNPGGGFGLDPFTGGDKGVTDLKSWMDAVMTTLWEAKSGTNWYSPTSRDNIKLLYTDGGGTLLSTNGDNFYWNSGTGHLTWKGLAVAFENSAVAFNSIVDSITEVPANALGDGQALFVEIQRGGGPSLVPVVGNLISLGSPVMPGSRIIIAWRIGSNVFTRDRAYNVNRSFGPASTSTLGAVELSRIASTPSTPIVISDGGGTILATTAGGYGLQATGDLAGTGVKGFGGATNGIGVEGTGAGTGAGGQFLGGTTAAGGIGVVATGRGTGAVGLRVQGGGAQAIDAQGSIVATGTITGANLSGTNTGNQTITLSGDVASGPGTGIQSVTVNTVGTSSAANVHAAELLANAATSADTANAIVRRDGSGNFNAGDISGAAFHSSGNFTATAGNALVLGPNVAVAAQNIVRANGSYTITGGVVSPLNGLGFGIGAGTIVSLATGTFSIAIPGGVMTTNNFAVTASIIRPSGYGVMAVESRTSSQIVLRAIDAQSGAFIDLTLPGTITIMLICTGCT